MNCQYAGKCNHSISFCQRCLHGFSSKHRLKEDLKFCCEHSAVSVIMPEERTKLKSINWQKTMSKPLVIYADTESICQKINTCPMTRKIHRLLIQKNKSPVHLESCLQDKRIMNIYFFVVLITQSDFMIGFDQLQVDFPH